MARDMAGKTAVVTGSSSGIGQAACARLLAAGWRVAGLDVHAEDTGGWRDGSQGIRCDVGDAASVEAAFARVGRPLHAVVTCAGVLRAGPLESVPIEDFDLVMRVNLRGTFLCAQKALPALQASAAPDAPTRIVLLSSIAALRPKVSGGVYAASKAAVSQLCRVMAAEWAPKGVLVNAIAPGTVDTPMVRAVSNPNSSAGYRPSGVSPVGRIAQPDDIVDLMMFLLSDGSRYMTGTTIPVDGGTQAAFIPPASV